MPAKPAPVIDQLISTGTNAAVATGEVAKNEVSGVLSIITDQLGLGLTQLARVAGFAVAGYFTSLVIIAVVNESYGHATARDRLTRRIAEIAQLRAAGKIRPFAARLMEQQAAISHRAAVRKTDAQAWRGIAAIRRKLPLI